jgi:hypothetical protein
MDGGIARPVLYDRLWPIAFLSCAHPGDGKCLHLVRVRGGDVGRDVSDNGVHAIPSIG